MTSPIIAELLQDLGSIQVFHYATLEAITAKWPPTEIYWQDKATRRVFGPFKHVHEALSHSIVTNAGKKSGKTYSENVIEIDFKLKKRKAYPNVSDK